MYINTNIVFQKIGGFGASAWCRYGDPVAIHRARYDRQRQTYSEGARNGQTDRIIEERAMHETHNAAA